MAILSETDFSRQPAAWIRFGKLRRAVDPLADGCRIMDCKSFESALILHPKLPKTKNPMKSLLCVIALVISLARIDAAFFLDGDLTWEITEPRCTFELDGELLNTGPSDSGTLKLVLWATAVPYPAPGTNYKVRTTSDVPLISGDYHFTIAVAEYTTSGWRNVLLVPTGTKRLTSGDFTAQKKWSLPTAKVTAPPAKLLKGDVLRLTLKATDEMNLLPDDAQEVTTLTIKTNTKLDAKMPPDISKAVYTYTVKKNRFNGKKVKSGRLFADFQKVDDEAESNFTYTLFFQGPTSGTYKSIESNA
jgi:hypothetical protein